MVLQLDTRITNRLARTVDRRRTLEAEAPRPGTIRVAREVAVSFVDAMAALRR